MSVLIHLKETLSILKLNEIWENNLKGSFKDFKKTLRPILEKKVLNLKFSGHIKEKHFCPEMLTHL
jgi:hypothetical protein